MSWPSQLSLTILFPCVVHSLSLLCSPSHQPRPPQVALSSQGASPKFEGLGCPHPTSGCGSGCPQPQTRLSFWGLHLCDQKVLAWALIPAISGEAVGRRFGLALGQKPGDLSLHGISANHALCTLLPYSKSLFWVKWDNNTYFPGQF